MTSSKLTKMGSKVKKQKEDGYQYGGERKGKQVIANSFIPTLIALFLFCMRWIRGPIHGYSVETIESIYSFCLIPDLLLLPTALAYYTECCADTWGSEVGILSSTPYLLLLPWKPVPAGTNGGMSLLGMGASVVAGVCMSILYYLIQPSNPSV